VGEKKSSAGGVLLAVAATVAVETKLEAEDINKADLEVSVTEDENDIGKLFDQLLL
jgi:hypothetical protein